MKINTNQEMQDEYGYPIRKKGRPAMTLWNVMINALLAPIRRTLGYDKDDEDSEKQEKWDIYKQLRKNINKEVDLESDDVATIKKAINKTQSQLIMGQAREMIEGKYERIEPVPGYAPEERLSKRELEASEDA